jgi:cytochrome P450
MLGRLEPGTEIELVEQIARPLPAQLFFDMVGFPRTERTDVYRWAEKAINLSDPFLTREQYRDYTAASGELYVFMNEMVEEKRKQLDDDLMSFLIRAGDEGDVIGPHEVAGNMLLLFLAGHHTTVNAFGNSVYALLTHPAQWELLVRDRSLVPNAVEELLRYDNTAQCMPRVVPEDYRIGEVTVPAGVHLLSWLASANRDEERFGPTAGELDVTRADADRSAAFGFGAHLCLGAALARLEMQAVLETLITSFPRTELLTPTPRWQHSAFLRGVEELRLRLDR